jgi:anti-sigma regulatory factor (Ser/Thr protein kinase)
MTTKHPGRQNPAVKEFILRNVAEHPDGIGPLTAREFGLSRTAVARTMKRLVDAGLLTAEGNTKARRYTLVPLAQEEFDVKLNAHVEEDVLWRFKVLPLLAGVRRNVVDICQYGFTEMLNNAVDHSGSAGARVRVTITYDAVTMFVADFGVGIFNKIMRDFALADPRSALLELSKGRLTSDRKRHSGEGIFFTSRMFDTFSILSGDYYYSSSNDESWLLDADYAHSSFDGTLVEMKISTECERTMRSVFERYQGDSTRFRKTQVPVKLGNYPGEQLVSRSQAKRLLARFDQFSEVLLDFQGVDEIGQPFADEVFRVFAADHPEIRILAIGTTPAIDQMIAMVRAAT